MAPQLHDTTRRAVMRAIVGAILLTLAVAGTWLLLRRRDLPPARPDAETIINPSTNPSANTGVNTGENRGAVTPDALTTTDPDKQRETPGIRFVDGLDETGLDFTHRAQRTPQRHMPEIMGAGVAVIDVNRDAAPDVLFIQSAPTPDDPRHPLFVSDGQGHFTLSDDWSPPAIGYGMGVAAGDYDNDGYPDLYITTADGRDRLYRNTTRGFVDTTEQAGITPEPGWSTSAGFVDIEPDGDLDLYVTRYVDYDSATAPPCYSAGHHVYCTPLLFDGLDDRLYRNNGDGTFTDVSTTMGISERRGKGLALGIADLDRDGRQDIYVANDTDANILWQLGENGRFENRAVIMGVGLSETGAEEGSMGVDVADLDGNGLPDIVCTNFQLETTSFYTQHDGGYFTEIADSRGIGRTARERLSFGIKCIDADNDGDEDLVVANGHIEDNIEQYRSDIGFAQPDTLYENRHGEFFDISDSAGTIITRPRVSRGLAVGDLDGDGALDVVVTTNDGPAAIALNRSPRRGRSLTLWLEGDRCNRSAIGAVVEVRTSRGLITREVKGASSYLSVSDPFVHVGWSRDAEPVKSITVRWPGGQVQNIEPRTVLPGHAYRIVEGQSPRRVTPGEGSPNRGPNR